MTYVTGIRLKNFARFRGEHEVAPLGPKPYAIVARAEDDEARSNWLGKSTLPVALRYALFGLLPDQYDTLDDAISRGEDEMAVDVELSDGSFVSRERRRGKWTKLKLVATDPLIGEVECHQDEAQREIVKLLGLDLDNYDACADIAQKKSDRFSTMKSSQLTEVVQAWVGLDRLVEAEDRASQGLGALTRELVLINSQMAGLAWATAEEGELRKTRQHAAALALEQQAKLAQAAGQEMARYERWTLHKQQADRAVAVLAEIEERRQLARQAGDPPTAQAIAVEEEQALQLRVAERALEREVRSLATVASGMFDGECPVLPGFACPVRQQINASQSKAAAAHAEKRSEYERANDRLNAQAAKVSTMKLAARSAERQVQQLAELESRYGQYDESLAYVREHGPPPAAAPPYVSVDSSASKLTERAHQEWLTARATLVAYEASRPAIARRVAALRVAVLALEQAQRRLCEGAVERVERGANRRLAVAGVDLSVEWRWGRETNRLSTRCGQCGTEFPASQRVKQCAACGAVRGQRVEPKLHVRLSDRSGAAEDFAGVAVSLSARDWICRQRGSDWGVVCLDEPFASLDLAHRRALAGHLCQLVSDGVEQSFVIAHDRAVLESLPGRIEVVGSGEWSRVRVVA